MADNKTGVDAAGATVTYATDDVSGVDYPRVKQSVGVDGAARDVIGDCTLHSRLGTASDNAVNVKASAGYVHFIHAHNINAATRYLKLYDKATAPSSADTPVMRIPLPPNVPMNINLDSHPAKFTLGIGFRIVTGIADSDNTAVAANEQVLNLGYN